MQGDRRRHHNRRRRRLHMGIVEEPVSHGYRAAYKRGLRVAGEHRDPRCPRHPRRELLIFERMCHGQAGLADENPKPTA
jgi:hypothetical protein